MAEDRIVTSQVYVQVGRRTEQQERWFKGNHPGDVIHEEDHRDKK